jgi:intelectin
MRTAIPCAAAFAALFAVSAPAGAQNLTLVHMGKILGSDDTPLEGTVLLTFRLYPVESEPSVEAIWTATYTVTPVAGVYTVELGSTRGGKPALPASAFAAGADRWLSIEIGTEGELSPRLRVGAVPFAINAGAVGGVEVSATPAAGKLLPLDSAGHFPETTLASAEAWSAKLDTVQASAPLAGNGTASQPLALAAAGPAAPGYLTSADWSAFNAKLDAVHAEAPLAGNGSLAQPLALPAAGPTLPGYLKKEDWLAFDAKLDHVAVAAPLTGTGVSAGTSIALPRASPTSDGYLSKDDWATLANTQVQVQVQAPLSGDGSASSKISISPATTSAAGSMSASDKAKLDGLGANVMPVLDAAPSGPSPGAFFFNSATSALQIWDGSIWRTFGGTYASCKAVLDSGASHGDGIYRIKPLASGPEFDTFCDMTTDGGGWTMVASLVDGDVLRSADSADQKWQESGQNRWADQAAFGAVDTSTRASNGDYKNPAYWQLNAKNLLIYHAPSGTPAATLRAGAFYVYRTNNDFLTGKGGSLYTLYKDNYPLTNGTAGTQGLKVDVVFDVGTATGLYNEENSNNRGESSSGGITILARNCEGYAIAMCPVKYNGCNSEHACVGGNGSTGGRGSGGWGDFREWAYDSTWGFSSRMKTAAMVLLTR